MYAAEHRDGAFAETFLRSPGENLIATDQLALKGECAYQTQRDGRFAKLYGPSLARLGATAEVSHRGLPYDIPQEWSKAIWSANLLIDGIAYSSRHDDQQICFAIFDRAKDLVSELSRTQVLNVSHIEDLLEAYKVGVAPD